MNTILNHTHHLQALGQNINAINKSLGDISKKMEEYNILIPQLQSKLIDLQFTNTTPNQPINDATIRALMQPEIHKLENKILSELDIHAIVRSEISNKIISEETIVNIVKQTLNTILNNQDPVDIQELNVQEELSESDIVIEKSDEEKPKKKGRKPKKI